MRRQILSLIFLTAVFQTTFSVDELIKNSKSDLETELEHLFKEALGQQTKMKVSEISAEELSRLQAHIGVTFDLESKTFVEVFSQKLTYQQMRGFPEDIRLIAGKLLIQFLEHNMSEESVIYTYLNPSKCRPVDHEVPGQRPWSYNHKRHQSLFALFRELSDRYELWYKSNSDYFKYRQFGGEVPDEQIQKTVARSVAVGQGVAPFFKRFDEVVDPLLEEFKDVRCNLKDYLSYFFQLKRFHKVYKVAPDTYTRSLRFVELGVAVKRAHARWGLIFYRVKLLKLFREVIQEYFFYLGKEQNRFFIAAYQTVLLDFGDLITMTLKKFCFFNRRMEKYFDELKFIIESLEDTADIKVKHFKHLDFSCSRVEIWKVLALVAGIFMALVF